MRHRIARNPLAVREHTSLELTKPRGRRFAEFQDEGRAATTAEAIRHGKQM